MEHIIPIKASEKSHIVNLNSKEHINFWVPGISGKWANAQLNNPNRRYQQQNHIK